MTMYYVSCCALAHQSNDEKCFVRLESDHSVGFVASGRCKADEELGDDVQ